MGHYSRLFRHAIIRPIYMLVLGIIVADDVSSDKLMICPLAMAGYGDGRVYKDTQWPHGRPSWASMSRLGRAVRATLVEYFKKTSLNGFGLLYFIRRRRYQRFFWFLFIAVGILTASFVVSTTLLKFLARPTIISLSATVLDGERPMRVPALTICSVNKLSRRQLAQYAQQLAKARGNSTEYWLSWLPLLAGYFYPSAVPAAAAAELQAKLGAGWPQDVRTQLLRLAPSCESLLLSCHLDSVAHNCSQLFRLEPSSEGCCCQLQTPSRFTTSLTLRLNASQADDFPMPRPQPHLHAGFTFHVPGRLGRLTVAPGESAELLLRSFHLQADPQLHSYPLVERGCHFPEEAEHILQCLPQCRLRSFIAACNCAPFVYDLADPSNGQLGNVSYCNLGHTACLQAVDGSWSPWECRECFPACNDWRFELRKNLLGRRMSTESKVRIRYGGQRLNIYRQNGLYNWYELLSNVGGVLSVCIGCSFISGFELVYFMVFRLWHNWRQLGRR